MAMSRLRKDDNIGLHSLQGAFPFLVSSHAFFTTILQHYNYPATRHSFRHLTLHERLLYVGLVLEEQGNGDNAE